MDYKDGLHNYDSDCGIFEEGNDDDRDNDDDEYNITQDAQYYDNAGNYNINNTDIDNKNKNEMNASNEVYHGGHGTNSNKPQQQRYQKEKEITGKSKKSRNRNDLVRLKQRLAKLAKKATTREVGIRQNGK